MTWLCLITSLFLPHAQAGTIPLLGSGFFPESIAYQASTHSLFVGGAGDGSVERVSAEGAATYFLAPGLDGRSETYGLKVDDARDRLWLVDGKAVYIYRIADRALLKKISRLDLGPTSDSFLNDIALDRAGNAWITDSRDPHLLRVSANFKAELLPLAIPFGEQNGIRYNLNGIVLAPDESAAYAVKTNDGSLWRIPLASLGPAEEVPLAYAVTHGDGLLWAEGKLVVLRNYENKVSAIDLASPLPRKPVVDFSIPSLATPTSAVYLKNALVIVNSQFANDPPVLPFSLTLFPLP